MSHHDDDNDDATRAVAQLLGVNSKFGILAGLALVAKKQQEQQSEDDEPSSRKVATQHKQRGATLVTNSDSSESSDVGVTASDGASTASSATLAAAAAAASKLNMSVHDQRDAIRKLQEQNQILKKELSIESRDARTMLRHDKRQQLAHLQMMAATYVRKIENVRRHVVRVDELLVKRTHELAALRQQQHNESVGKVSDTTAGAAAAPSTGTLASNDNSSTSGSGGGAAAAAESSAASMRRLRAIENRLELSLVKKNEMDSINKHLRAQIEKVRRDRVIFDGIYKKLEREMSEYRQRYDLSVDEVQRATDAKQQVNIELAKLQTRAEHDQRLYEQQFQELKAAIETSLREAARLSGNGTSSVLAGAASSSFAYKTSDADELSSLGGSNSSNSYAKDTSLTRVSVLSSWKIGYDRALATTNESAVAKYDAALAGIKQLTGIDDVAKIADAIVARDDANFKRFKRVEELHEDEVALQIQIDALTTQIDAFKAREGIATSASQKQQCRALTEQLEHAVAKSHAFDSDFDDTTAALARLKSSVHSIHSMLAHASCARSVDSFSQGSAHLALGSHSARDVTDTNVLEYLQAIETFTTSLIKETHDAAAVAAAATTGVTSGESESARVGLSVAAASPGYQETHSAVAADTNALNFMTTLPIGHGPLTLPSDPAQKLRVQVPSFGGVNGVLIVPASSPFVDSDAANDIDGSSTSNTNKHSQSPIKSLRHHHHQQQQLLHQGLQRRKSASRFELTARKSLSQMQFVAALSAATVAAITTSDQPLASVHSPVHVLHDTSSSSHSETTAQGTAAESQLARAKLEEEEEERALTYDELRQFAVKNVVKRKSDAVAEATSPS